MSGDRPNPTRFPPRAAGTCHWTCHCRQLISETSSPSGGHQRFRPEDLARAKPTRVRSTHAAVVRVAALATVLSGGAVVEAPPEYIEWLEGLHVKWLGLSVTLTYDDSMDSTVERNTEYLPPSDDVSFSDDALRQLIRELKEHGIDVFLTLAFQAYAAQTSARPVERWQLGDPGGEDGVPCCETGILPENWPWRPDHPDHRRFVAEFWETYTQRAVHVARIAEEEGVRLFSLGTETDSLFRTRPGGHFTNDFRSELRAMVSRVRAVYSGLLTYDQHYGVLVNTGPAWDHLWGDLDLDVVGVSAWFPLVDSPPSTVMSVESLRESYARVFRDHLVPLAGRNPDRPILFLEYGAPSSVEAPADPAGDWTAEPFVFTDMNGNGIDDGNETQANIYRALLDTMSDHPGLIDGVFWWDNWITTADMWAGYWATRRTSAIRDKPAGEVVRSVYASWRDLANRPPEPVGALPPVMMGVDGAAASIDITGAFRDPDGDRLMYRAASSAPAVAATSVSGSTVTVTPLAAGTATVTVTATDPSRLSAAQTFGVTIASTATGSFTDDPIVPGVTPVKAVHFTELRTRIDALRVTAGCSGSASSPRRPHDGAARRCEPRGVDGIGRCGERETNGRDAARKPSRRAPASTARSATACRWGAVSGGRCGSASACRNMGGTTGSATASRAEPRSATESAVPVDVRRCGVPGRLTRAPEYPRSP